MLLHIHSSKTTFDPLHHSSTSHIVPNNYPYVTSYYMWIVPVNVSTPAQLSALAVRKPTCIFCMHILQYLRALRQHFTHHSCLLKIEEAATHFTRHHTFDLHLIEHLNIYAENTKFDYNTQFSIMSAQIWNHIQKFSSTTHIARNFTFINEK